MERNDMDFYVYLTKEDILKITQRITHKEDPFHAGQYHTLSSEIKDMSEHKRPYNESFTITSTRDVCLLSDTDHTHDNIYFNYVEVYKCDECGKIFSTDEWADILPICPFDDVEMQVIDRGPYVKIFPPLLGELLEGKDHIGTRYNGEDRILIFCE